MTQRLHPLLVTCRPSGQLVRIVHGMSLLLLQQGVARSLRELMDPGDIDSYERFMQALGERGRAFDWELRVRSLEAEGAMRFAGIAGDGVFWIAAAPDPAAVLGLLAEAEPEIERVELRERAQPGTAIVFDELTRVNNDLVNLQRELAQRNAALVELTRERNQLLGIAAHDLRNPLMVVQSYCELLLSSRGGPLGPTKTQFVERVHEATDAMLQLLADTLDYSRLASADVTLATAPTDLSHLVQASVLDYQPLAERKHIALSFHPSEQPLPAVPLDGTKIERVVVNLLSNAIKYSREGAAVDVYVARSGRFARVSVCDRGEGVSAEDAPLLFLPFQTGSSRPTAGETSTGLGLAIVKKLVEAHGGHVAVSSCQPRGSSFSFELPFEPPALPPDVAVLVGRPH